MAVFDHGLGLGDRKKTLSIRIETARSVGGTPWFVPMGLACALLLTGISPEAAALTTYIHRFGDGYAGAVSLEAIYSQAQNFYYQNSGSTDASGVVLRPALTLVSDRALYKLAGSASGEYGTFSAPGSQDDYFDTQTGLALRVDPASRHHFGVEVGRLDKHDPFGQVRTAGNPFFSQELDKWNESSGSTFYRFGTEGAHINVELRAGDLERKYTTNRAFTQFLDYGVVNLQSTIFYNLSPKTAALLEIQHYKVSYQQEFPGGVPRDNTELRLLSGVSWKAAAKTTGDVRVGWYNRKDAAGRAIGSGFDWTASLDWRPATKTDFLVETGRKTEQSYVSTASAIDARKYAATWSQTLLYGLGTRVGASLYTYDFVDSGRRDKVSSVQAEINYTLKQYLALFGSFSSSNRNSTDPSVEYNALVTMVGLRLTP